MNQLISFQKISNALFNEWNLDIASSPKKIYGVTSIFLILVILCGCATNCETERMFHITPLDETLFQISSTGDDILLESKAVSIWFDSCLDIAQDQRIRGTICFTLIIPEGSRVQMENPYGEFLGEAADLPITGSLIRRVTPMFVTTDQDGSNKRAGVISSKTILPEDELNGENLTSHVSIFANRAQRIIGKRYQFVVFDTPQMTKTQILTMPIMFVSGSQISVPRLKLEPVFAEPHCRVGI